MQSRSSQRRGPALIALALVAAASAPLARAAAPTSGTETFGYTGAQQTFTVPAGVHRVRATLAGAAGGRAWSWYSAIGTGGLGAVMTTTLDVEPGQELQVYVGGSGGATSAGSGGGFNGGGIGGQLDAYPLHGGGGGGATDVRTGPSLAERIAIAAGGGGAGSSGTAGGAGGEVGDAGTGETSPTTVVYPGGGATSTEGGAAGYDETPGIDPMTPGTAGTLGQGGNGGYGYNDATQWSPGAGGGGGGGLYGGGGGGGGYEYAVSAGGGGGSSYSARPATFAAEGNAGAGWITLLWSLPGITASASPPANDLGWHDSAVTVSFACEDPDSAIASCTAPQVAATEGRDIVVAGTAVNEDGNTTSTSLALNIDLTPPAVTGAATTQPNAAGWYRDDVTIAWTCSDQLSGIDQASEVTPGRPSMCSAPSTISGEGTDLSAVGTAVDVAGNRADATVSGIAIDRTPPVTASDHPASAPGAVWVPLIATDNLSGVADTYYTLDGCCGGTETRGTSVYVYGEGTHTLSYYSVDAAGNAEEPVTVTILIDETAPTISHALDPAANAAGWNDGPTMVSFSCDDGFSGIASCSGPVQISTEGRSQEVTGTATDRAGNTAHDTAAVNLDATDPTISAIASPPPNEAGWHRTPVDVVFSCADALSGIVSCPAPTAMDAEGEGQSAAGAAIDAAGNSASVVVDDINIDRTPPAIVGTILETPNEAGWFDGSVTVRWTCSDELSGVAACPADTVISTEGTGQSVSAAAFDVAGNQAIGTVSGINIDRSPPQISATRDVQPNAHGWNRTDVTVTWTCTDSGDVTLSEASYTFTSEGRNLRRTSWCTDTAGNATPDTQTANIDRTGPVTEIDPYLFGDLRGSATDGLSGVSQTIVTWRVVEAHGQAAFCYEGCGGSLARWRATPPKPRPNVYQVEVASRDLAGNTGMTDRDIILAGPGD